MRKDKELNTLSPTCLPNNPKVYECYDNKLSCYQNLKLTGVSRPKTNLAFYQSCEVKFLFLQMSVLNFVEHLYSCFWIS